MNETVWYNSFYRYFLSRKTYRARSVHFIIYKFPFILHIFSESEANHWNSIEIKIADYMQIRALAYATTMNVQQLKQNDGIRFSPKPSLCCIPHSWNGHSAALECALYNFSVLFFQTIQTWTDHKLEFLLPHCGNGQVSESSNLVLHFEYLSKTIFNVCLSLTLSFRMKYNQFRVERKLTLDSTFMKFAYQSPNNNTQSSEFLIIKMIATLMKKTNKQMNCLPQTHKLTQIQKTIQNEDVLQLLAQPIVIDLNKLSKWRIRMCHKAHDFCLFLLSLLVSQ